jgi:hypothetical protein
MNTHSPIRPRASNACRHRRTMVRNLGWFSIALGVVELLAARHLARGADLPHDDVAVARIAGVRGVAAGIGLLEGRPGVHIGARVAGDVLDLATLALPARRFDAGPMRRRYPALAVTAAVTALDLYAAYALYTGGRRARRPHQCAVTTPAHRLQPDGHASARRRARLRRAARLRTPELLRPFGAAAA